jgi:ABC-type lipoprotein release transport system permease subunit
MLPILFAAFTILLAITTLAHVSASVVRRRAGDIAVMRVLGLTPRQARFTLSWQATTIAVIGLLIGLPIGVLIGQMSWRWVAESTPMLYVAPLGLLTMLVVVPAWLLTANLLALWPGRNAARMRPAEVLRRE